MGAPRDARAARLRQRGRQADRRRPQRAPGVRPATNTQGNTSLSATGPYTWTPDKLFGFYYPDEQRRRRRPAGHRVPALARDVQRHVAELPRRHRPPVGGVGVTGTTARTPARRSRPKAGGLFDGMSADRRRRGAGQRPEPGRRRHAAAAGQAPLRLRNWAAVGAANEPLRAETHRGRLHHDPGRRHATGGAIISTRDAVTFGFGLEQVDRGHAQRAASSAASSYLLPDRRRTPRAPTIVGFKYPADELRRRRPADPVELELTAYDERGDMEQVDLYANGALVATTRGLSRSSSATRRRPRPSARR